MQRVYEDDIDRKSKTNERQREKQREMGKEEIYSSRGAATLVGQFCWRCSRSAEFCEPRAELASDETPDSEMA